MSNNLIFLDELELNTPIYRIFSFDRLEEIFSERKLALVKPAMWDDPFENFILKSTVHLGNGLEATIDYRNSFYGQCWSLSSENDGMWRIYSPTKDGVKVKTTIRKLFSPLFSLTSEYDDLNNRTYSLSTFIGRVQYKSERTLTKMLTNQILMNQKLFDSSGRGQASSFMFKRNEFKHEQEIRIVHNAQGDNESNVFKYDVDPALLFDEIIFDPRMDESTYSNRRNVILGWGYPNKIDQSNLYKLKNFTIALTNS
jgi:hypothetical protein